MIKTRYSNRKPLIMPVREQDRWISRNLAERFEKILPLAMRETGLDMWLIICLEDDLDPVFKTMIPMNTWTPILQMLVFFDRGESSGVERINLSMTDTGDLYQRPWSGRDPNEQWELLAQIVTERDPQRIGINIGSTQWAAGGLTCHLYQQLTSCLGATFTDRLVSAEAACTRWLMTLTQRELEFLPHLARIAHWLIADCFSPQSIQPGTTTTEDLEWTYWQNAVDLGLELSFKPYFRIFRSENDQRLYGTDRQTIHSGDLVHCDVGVRYMRMCSDHQELCYVRRPRESEAPSGLVHLLAENNRLQQIFRNEFKQGLSGNELLSRILAEARAQGIPNPKVYSHSLGLMLHEPGPLLGLPWEQQNTGERGEVRLQLNSCFTMELSVEAPLPEWGGQLVRLPTEQDVIFMEEGCLPLGGVQTEYHLI